MQKEWDKASSFPYYVLNEDHTYRLETDIRVYSEWYKDHSNRRVAEDYVGPWHISTVILSIDHNMSGRGAPVLFETMVFGPAPFEDETERYCSWTAAVAGHATMVQRVRAHLEGEATSGR